MRLSIFGKKKKAKGPKKHNPETTLQAISKMDATITNLDKRRDLLGKRCMGFIKDAKAQHAKGNKKGALFALKKKKMYEKQIVNLDNQILSLEQQKMALEASALQKTVVDTMSNGAKAMKTIHGEMDVDAVEDLRADIEETMDITNEINDVFATPLGDAYDEDELDDELNELMLDEADEAELQMTAAATPALPDVPQQVPNLPEPVVQKPAAVAADPDADEFAELEALMWSIGVVAIACLVEHVEAI